MRPEVWEEDRILDRPLRRPRRGRMLAGVCVGIARWLRWDPVVVRLAFLLLAVIASPFAAVAVYGVLWLVIPEARNPVERAMEYWEDLGPL